MGIHYITAFVEFCRTIVLAKYLCLVVTLVFSLYNKLILSKGKSLWKEVLVFVNGYLLIWILLQKIERLEEELNRYKQHDKNWVVSSEQISTCSVFHIKKRYASPHAYQVLLSWQIFFSWCHYNIICSICQWNYFYTIYDIYMKKAPLPVVEEPLSSVTRIYDKTRTSRQAVCIHTLFVV